MNYDKYIGLPYKDNGRDIDGIDCWGLVRLYYKEELNIDLPSYVDEYTGPYDTNVTRAISLYKDSWNKTTTPRAGDVVLFNIYGEPAHVGVYVGNNKFLHCREGRDSVVESLANIKWNKRLDGIYKYSENTQIEVIGMPHPLKTNVYREWTVAGTTVEDFALFVQNKYTLSPHYADKLVVVIDGIPIAKENWATTVVQAGQTIAYRAVPQGRDTFKMILILAVVLIAPELAMGGFKGAVPSLGLTAGTWQATAATMAISMAGMALVNAIMPVRMPTTNDPGSPNALNLFSGTSNQVNKFGPIPVVLGKARMTAMLGASPYIETLTDTTILNLLLVWGFGPLSITDLCVGANRIENLNEGLALTMPKPAIIYGRPEEDQTAFNSLYGSDVEQAPAKSVELVNNATDGNPWQSIFFNQESTRVDVAFTFPEGMRTINIKDGKVTPATAAVEIQLGTYNSTTNAWTFESTPTYSVGAYNSNQLNSNAYTTTLNLPGTAVRYNSSSGEYEAVTLYRYSIFAMAPGGGVQRYDGAATDILNSPPSAEMIAEYKAGTYASLVGDGGTYTHLPQIPPSSLKLYTVVMTNSGIIEPVTSHLSSYVGYNGLALTPTQITEQVQVSSDSGPETRLTAVKIAIQAGKVWNDSTPAGQVEASAATPVEIFNSTQYAGVNSTFSKYSGWSSFLQTYGVRPTNYTGSTSDTLNIIKTVSLPYSGYYDIEAAADDAGSVEIDAKPVVLMPINSWRETVTTSIYLEAGDHTVRLKGDNSGGRDMAAAVRITFTKSGLNTVSTLHTEIVFGTSGVSKARKDAFGYTQYFTQLPKARYAVRCRRTDNDANEEGDFRKYSKVVFFTAACFDNTRPAVNPPGVYIAKTAVRVQSTNKVNGSVDGLNALVQSICLDWDKTTQKWISRPTNNPASLFAYILMHPGNAYKISSTEWANKIDLPSLQSWHEFCDGNNPSGGRLTYNNIITNSMSVMDVLRDICAAGLGSPVFLDGKWSVVVDRPRSFTTQYFTPHNSWGYESTKALPRLPHAFRVTIVDEEQSYQTSEYIIYNYGYDKDTTAGKLEATIFESITLPGVTNAAQAKFLARWHHAQLKLRPETYTLNTDFEYLVCNRGDVVKVSHDVPLWGVGTGRIKSIINSTTLELTEPVNLTGGKTYRILVRVNDKTKPNGTTKTIDLATTTPGITTGQVVSVSVIRLLSTEPIVLADGLEADNLFMLGEIGKETQELVVINVEPTSTAGAKLTLVDYAPSIYTANLSELLTYDANVTLRNNDIVKNTITKAPIIAQVTSDSVLSEAISGGTYQNVVIVSFSNPADLTIQAEQIESQIVRGDSDFGSNNLTELYRVDKSVSSLTVNGLTTGSVYKIRARYSNKSGTIVGPWSDTFWFTNAGKTVNGSAAPLLTLDLDRTFVVVKPDVTLQTADFDTYEYRLYKDTGIEDFWELVPNASTNNIKVIKSTGEARFDLREQPRPRLSQSGVTYRVACRALDKQGNYSTISTLGTIVVRTIT
jgi:hypothetical protein